MEVDHGKGKSRGKKGRANKGKRKHKGKSKGKGKGRRPGPRLLCQGPHWARACPPHHGGKGKRATSFGKGSKNSSPFRQAYLEGNEQDWMTGGHLCRILSVSTLTGNLFSTLGGVDLLQRIREIYADAGLQLTSRSVSPLGFSLANGQEAVSTSVLPVPYLP